MQSHCQRTINSMCRQSTSTFAIILFVKQLRMQKLKSSAFQWTTMFPTCHLWKWSSGTLLNFLDCDQCLGGNSCAAWQFHSVEMEQKVFVFIFLYTHWLIGKCWIYASHTHYDMIYLYITFYRHYYIMWSISLLIFVHCISSSYQKLKQILSSCDLFLRFFNKMAVLLCLQWKPSKGHQLFSDVHYGWSDFYSLFIIKITMTMIIRPSIVTLKCLHRQY